MIKGTSRQVVLVKPQGEAAFEQAIFIVKDNAVGITEKELLRQAGLAATGVGAAKLHRRFFDAVTFFSGAGLVGLTWLLTAIL